ncbi:TonB-dependent receptor [Gammaproteobacteria bacterium]|nr:TonB-dependent receptor [Gammaproteobacteria bacterium]MDA7844002.1 TonB-dependent receptor [Gammaproteobacteria bacterium]MDA8955502.1 TonB-dependent receptor [Gammaproteobacteria bacterium]
MNNKIILTLFLSLFITFNAYADNPGDEPADTVTATVQESTTDSESTDSEEEVTSTPVVTSEDDEEVVQLQKVVVTGSRVKRTQVAGALPLIVITKEDIDASGFRNVTEALQSLPQGSAGNQGESEVNTFTPNANEINLRSVGPGRVLYLINGRRTADYPLPYNNASNFVNTGTIPSGLVDRIEIISQGSSAIYGSDAVTGVINIITTTGKDFSEFDFDIMQTEHGGDQIASLSFTTGGFSENSSWTVGIDASKVDPMYLSDREGFDSWKDNPLYGEVYANPRWGSAIQVGSNFGADTATYSAEDFGYKCDSQEHSGGAFQLFSRDKPEVYGTTNYQGSYQGYACMYGRGAEGGDTQTIVNQRDDLTIMGSFTHNFDSGMQFDARLFYKDETAYLRSNVSRYVQLGTFYDPLRLQSYVGDLPGNDLVPTNPNAALVAYHLRYFSPAMGEAFESKSDYEEDVTDIFAGLSGTYDNGWEWSAGVNATKYNSVVSSRTLTSGIYDYMAGVGLLDPNSVREDGLAYGTYWANAYGPAYEVFDADPSYGYNGQPCSYQGFYGYNNCFLPDRLFGAISNEQMNSWLADDTTTSWSEQIFADYDVTGEFGDVNGAPIGFAFNVEYQTQDYELTPSAGRLDDVQFGGDDAIDFIQGSTRFGGGDRQRWSVGVEFSVPLSDNLELGLASRTDNYDDDSSKVGGAVSNMANLAYRPNENLLLRASASQSFRAPDMHYIYAGESSAFSSGFDYVSCYVADRPGGTSGTGSAFTAELCDPIHSFSGRQFNSGNKELVEEKGQNYSFGFVWQVAENLSVQWDAYQVVLEDAVRTESISSVIAQSGQCLYGQDFQTWYGSNINQASCTDIASRIVRGPTTDPLSGDTLPIGPLESVKVQPRNSAFLEYIGHDTFVRWTKETENLGDFRVTVSSSTTVRRNQKLDAESETFDLLEYYIYEPRSQQNVNVGWSRQDHSLNLFADRMGHMNIRQGLESNPHITYNLSYGYDYSPDIQLYAAVINVTDVMPQKDAYASYPYYEGSYFSVMGRYARLGFNYRF